MKDVGLLLLRLVAGGLLAGHGSQMLFGWFGGYGRRGTAGWLESLGIEPGDKWALAAGGSQLAGGALMALGLFWPVGPITAIGPMGMAVGTVHWGRPIWVTEGGAELPVTNMAIAAALTMTGPGRIALDRLLRLGTPWPLTVLTAVGVAAGVALGLYVSRERPEGIGPAAGQEAESQEEASAARQQAGTAQERT